MRVHKLIASAVVSAAMLLQAWTLKEVVSLKVEVAQIAVKLASLEHHRPPLAINP